jgi:hypothetical protein
LGGDSGGKDGVRWNLGEGWRIGRMLEGFGEEEWLLGRMEGGRILEVWGGHCQSWGRIEFR